MKRIVLFASGSGSNVENIAAYFKDSKTVEISAVFSNKKEAVVLERCNRLGISAFYFNRHAFRERDTVLRALKGLEPDLIVLAGFLWKMPDNILQAFPQRIINIHPALLPKYGGKGMYGLKVHQAVVEKGERETGITIHYVNEHYDQGAVIRQYRIDLDARDNAEAVARKVHQLEHTYFPRVIEELLTSG